MSTFSGIVEWTANTLSLLAAIAIGVMLVKENLPANEAYAAGTLAAGTTVNVPDVAWSSHDKTVVLALSVSCGYCTASAPFYRELVDATATKDIHTVAVFPQHTLESTVYLKMKGIVVDDVREADLGTLGVRGTPTLMIVGRDGRVLAGWNGKLTPGQESEVLQTLGVARPDRAATADGNGAANPSVRATPGELAEIIRSQGPVPIVDIRERDPFAKGHIQDALNIPLLELDVRAAVEVPKQRPVFIYCRYSSECENSASGAGVTTWCSVSQFLLKDLGFTDVRAIVGDLQQLKAAGVPVAGDPLEQPRVDGKTQ